MSAFGFTTEDTYELAYHAVERDTSGIVEWMEAHIRTARDMHALMEFMGRVIYRTWPLSLTKDVRVGPRDFWAMEVAPGAHPNAAQRTSTQMITASLNADWDTLTALIHTALGAREEFHAEVTVHLIAAMGDGLRAVPESSDPHPRQARLDGESTDVTEGV